MSILIPPSPSPTRPCPFLSSLLIHHRLPSPFASRLPSPWPASTEDEVKAGQRATNVTGRGGVAVRKGMSQSSPWPVGWRMRRDATLFWWVPRGPIYSVAQFRSDAKHWCDGVVSHRVWLELTCWVRVDPPHHFHIRRTPSSSEWWGTRTDHFRFSELGLGIY